MRRTALAAALALATALAAVAAAGDEKAGKDLPKPPTTPLPEYEDPLFDAKVGETMLYEVHDLKGAWKRYFEERVLARDEERKKVLVETIETDEKGAAAYGIDGRRSGWRDLSKELRLPAGFSWKADKPPRDEVVYLGDPPTKAVRSTHRYLDEPIDPNSPAMGRRLRDIWFSHDVAVTGRVKMHPAQQDGERVAVSWSKTLDAKECAARAERYPLPPDEEKKDPKKPEPAMEDPGMSEPGMDEPAMGESEMGG